MANEANVSVRFSTKDTDLVKKALQDFGAEGQKVLDKLENATKQPSDGLRALNVVVKEGQAQVASYAGSLGTFGSALSAIGPAGLAAAAGLGGMAAAAKFAFSSIKAEAEKAGAIKDVADKIGLTTDALQELQYAALESGVEQEKLNNALTRFAVNIGDAAAGSGELAGILREYGINVVDANKNTRAQADILADVADAMQRANSDQERLRIAVAAFSKEGAGMVNMMRDGSAALDEYKAKAHAAGLVLNGDLLDAAKRLNDEFERLEKIAATAKAEVILGGGADAERNIQNLESATRLWAQIEGHVVNSVSTIVSNAADMIRFFGSDGPLATVMRGINNKYGDQPASARARYEPPTLDFTHRALTTNLTASEVTKLTEELNKLIASTDQVAAATAKYQRGLEIVNRLVADHSLSSKEASEATAALTDAYNEVTIAAAFKATPAHKSVEAALYGQVLENEALIAAMKKSEYEYDVTVKKLKLVKDGFDGTAEAADAYARKLVDQEHKIRDSKQAWDDQASAAKKAAEDAVRNAEAMARSINRFAQDMGANIIDAFINMAEGAKNPFDRLLNYARQTFTKMAAEAILNPIVVPIISQLVGAVGGGGVSSFAGGAGGMASGANALLGLGGTAFGGYLNTLGATYLGTGATAGSLAGAASNSVSLSALNAPLLTSYLGAGALGGLGGYLLADLTGMKNKTYASMGAGAGAMIGLGVGGPVGALAGALIGSLAGLFGPGPSDKLQGDWLNFNTGSMSAYGYTGNKYSAENAQAAGALGTSLLNFGNLLTGAGLKPNFATNARVEAGSNGAPFRVWYGGLNGDTGATYQDPQSAFQAVASEILKSLSDVPANLQRVIDNIDYSNLEKFADDLNDAIQWTATVQGIHDQLQQLKDPKGYELSQLDAIFDPLKQKARETGEGLADIEELYGIRRQEILARYAEGATQAFNLGDAWAGMNNAEGRGFLNDIQGAVLSHTSGLTAAGSNATGQEWVNRTFTATLRNILGNGNLTADQLTVVKNTFASIPEVITAANEALANLLAVANPTADALSRLPDLLREAASAQMDLVRDQIDSAKSLQAYYQNAGGTFRNAAFALDFNASTSTGTLADQFAMAQAAFEADRPNALLGNQAAMDRIEDEGNNFAALAKQMFGSSSQFVDIQRRVKDTFLRVADMSDRQASLASQSLDVAQRQLVELQKIASGSLTGGSAGAKTYTAADLDALNQAFATVYNAGQAPPGSATFDMFKTILLTEIGGLNDVGRLKSDFGFQATQIGSNNPAAVAAPDIVRAIAARLGELGQGGSPDLLAAIAGIASVNANLAAEIRNLLARLPRAA